MRVDRQQQGGGVGQVVQECPLSMLVVIIREPDGDVQAARAIVRRLDESLQPTILETGGGTTSYTYSKVPAATYRLQAAFQDAAGVWSTAVSEVEVGEREVVLAEFRPRKLTLDRDPVLVAVDGRVTITLFAEGDDPAFGRANPALVLSRGDTRLALYRDAEFTDALALDEEHAAILDKAYVAAHPTVYGKGVQEGLVEITLRNGDDPPPAKPVSVSGPP
ncbi:MAG TPA: hypothetical protein VF541_10210, partial [Longimicrobium sp.]